MSSITKLAKFEDLPDGAIFTLRSIKWIKVNESNLYNAVRLHDSSKACTFSANIIVSIEVELTHDDSDSEESIRNLPGYNEGF